MRAVVQRVTSASVTAGGSVVARIDAGLLVLAGVAQGDEPRDTEYIANKLCELRVFPDEAGRMNRSVIDTGGALLVVSQFTLLADCRRGRRPSFDAAAPPPIAESLYNDLLARLRARGLSVGAGVFQAHMDVALVNDGPVTILLDSRRLF